MANIVCVGDTHGNVPAFNYIVAQNENTADLILQVGDFGFGFLNKYKPNYPKNVKILLGNHDDPEAINQFPDVVLGNYGYLEEYGIGYVRGAWSIDYARRTEGKSWWKGEELTYAEMEEAINFLESKKPKIMVTHDAPESAYPILLKHSQFGLGYIPTRTTAGLQTILEVVKPKLWIHGHHHVNETYKINDTIFESLAIDEAFKFNTEDF